MPIEVCRLLIVCGHPLALMYLCVMEEAGPEELYVLLLQGCQQCLLLIERVAAVLVGEHVEKEYLHKGVVGGQHVLGIHVMGNGSKLAVLGYQLRISDIRLITFSIAGIIFCLLQYVHIFLCCHQLTIDERAFQQVFYEVYPPSVLHTVLKAPAVAEVHLAVVEIQLLAARLRKPYQERSIARRITILVSKHLVAGTSEPCERKVLHHPHHSCRLLVGIHGAVLAEHSFPVLVVYAVVHAYLVVEIAVLVPEMPCGKSHAANKHEL